MDSKTWIKMWFEECEKNGVNPWEWDFKQSYSKNRISKTDSPISILLNYKLQGMDEIGPFNTTNKTGEDADCDKEPFPIYNVLWETELDKYQVIRGETMNSFITTFNNSIIISDNKDIIYNDIGIDSKKKLIEQYDKLIDMDNFSKFSFIKQNLKEFEKFASSTHFIGNFTILPHWMNTGRYNFSQDYWDITLQSLFDLLNPLGAWKNFVETYFLQPYVKRDEVWSVDEFWKGHFSKIGLHFTKIRPQSSPELHNFLSLNNLRIEERGKWIIKTLCDRYDLINYSFYKDIKELNICFSDELK